MKEVKLQLSPAEKEVRKLKAKIRRRRGKIQHLNEEIRKCRVTMAQAGKRADELEMIRRSHQADKDQFEKELEKKGA